MSFDDKTLRGVPPGSLIGPFSSAEITAAGERIAERDRVEAIAAAAEIKAGWLAVNARANATPQASDTPAKPSAGPSVAIIARHNAEPRRAGDDASDGDAKASHNHGWGRYLP
jgi:hypothetical protein